MATVLHTYVDARERLRTTGVTRQTREPWNHQGRPIVATLESGDILILREKGRRTSFQAPLGEIFQWMVKRNLARAERERKAGGRARRKK